MFSFLNIPTAISIFYFSQLLLGSWATYATARRISIGQPAALFCAVAFTFSAPSAQVVFTDLWVSHAFGWYFLPVVMYLLVSVMTEQNDGRCLGYALLLGVATGLWIWNSHPGHLSVILAGVAVFVACSGRPVFYKFGYLALAALIALVISSDKIYVLAMEVAAQPEGLVRSGRMAAVSDVVTVYRAAVWRGLIKPWHHNYLSLVMANNISLRELFLGLPIFLLALGALLPGLIRKPFRPALFIAIAACLLLYMAPANYLPKVFGPQWLFRDPITFFAILLAGTTLDWLFRAGPLACAVGVALIGAQFFQMMVALSPSAVIAACTVPRAFCDHQSVSVLGAALRKVDFETLLGATKLTNDMNRLGVTSQDRIYVSSGANRWVRSTRSKENPSEIFANILALKGFRQLQGSFKGISTDALYPDSQMARGRIRAQEDVLRNPDLVSVLAVDYVLAAPDETMPGYLQQVGNEVIGGSRLRLYSNPSAWGVATFVNPELIAQKLPRRESCEHDRLLCADFQSVREARLSDPIKSAALVSDITLEFEPKETKRTAFVSVQFRPGWQGISDRGDKMKISPLAEQFIGVEVPAGTTRIRLYYRPMQRVVMLIAALAAIFLSLIFGLWLLLRKSSPQPRNLPGT